MTAERESTNCGGKRFSSGKGERGHLDKHCLILEGRIDLRKGEVIPE